MSGDSESRESSREAARQARLSITDDEFNRRMDPFALDRSMVPPGRDRQLQNEFQREVRDSTPGQAAGVERDSQTRAATSPTTPARNVPVGTGSDTAPAARRAPGSRPGRPQPAVRRRTRLESARPRRTGLRIDFTERQKRSTAGLGIAGQ